MFSSKDYIEKLLAENLGPYFTSHENKTINIGVFRSDINLSKLTVKSRNWDIAGTTISLSSGQVLGLTVKTPWNAVSKLTHEKTEVALKSVHLFFDISLKPFMYANASSSGRDSSFIADLLEDIKLVSVAHNYFMNGKFNRLSLSPVRFRKN